MHSFAVPLFDSVGSVSGGLAVASPRSRVTPEHTRVVLSGLARAGRELTELPALFTVTLSLTSPLTVTVGYATSDGTAPAGSD